MIWKNQCVARTIRYASIWAVFHAKNIEKDSFRCAIAASNIEREDSK